MAYLVTGGCGFVGSNVSAELLKRGKQLLIMDDLSRLGSAKNLAWLREVGEFQFFQFDVRELRDLESLFKDHRVECVFHLAGQVAMTTSIAEPMRDFEINVVGTLNLLECIRKFAPEATVVYASSNKVYGELERLTLVEKATRYEPIEQKMIDEHAGLDFRTPYGCSKGAADQYMLEYARNFGLNSVVFRHSTIYGGRQVATFDQGWVGWFCQKAIESRKDPQTSFTINGNGKQVRDLLYVSDAVGAYLAAHENISAARGQAFNIGGGYENSMSVLELLIHLERSLDVSLDPNKLPWRANDQKYFVADCSRASNILSWKPLVSKEAGIESTLEWQLKRNPKDNV
jgi:CDP-paratose 2-epimerase